MFDQVDGGCVVVLVFDAVGRRSVGSVVEVTRILSQGEKLSVENASPFIAVGDIVPSSSHQQGQTGSLVCDLRLQLR